MRTDAERHAFDAKVGATAAQVAGIEAALRTLDLHANELDALTRETTMAENDYRRSVERLEEARVAARLDKDKVDSVRIVEAPSVPTRPIWPRTGLNVAIAAGVGALAAGATAYLRERVQRTFALPETVEREVGVRVLATVPRR
jgi:tyrosine-protein kinase Etk/Wzc